MKDNFPASLAAVLKSEGGYVNNPNDTGGATNKGITQREYDFWRTKHGLAKQAVRAIADAEVAAIYRQEYWDAINGDTLAVGFDYAVFDFAVNSGVVRARNMAATAPTIDGLCDARLKFMQSLSTWKFFGKGWKARVEGVRALANKMAATPTPPAKASPAASLQPATPTKATGEKIMATNPINLQNLNIASIITAAASFGALLPKISAEYGSFGIYAAGALGVALLIQFFIPAQAAVIEKVVAEDVIPLAEGLKPGLKPILDPVAQGLKDAAATQTGA